VEETTPHGICVFNLNPCHNAHGSCHETTFPFIDAFYLRPDHMVSDSCAGGKGTNSKSIQNNPGVKLAKQLGDVCLLESKFFTGF